MTRLPYPMNQKNIYAISVVVGIAIGGVVIFFATRGGKTPSSPLTPAPSPVTVDETAFASWLEVTPDGRLFTAKFPAAPQLSTNKVPIQDTDLSIIQELHVAKDEQDNAYFAVTFVYPRPFDVDDPQGVLKTVLDGMVTALPGAQLADSSAADYQGRPALEFMIKDPNQLITQGKLFFRERVLYQVMVTYEEGSLEEAAYLYFLKSFRPAA